MQALISVSILSQNCQELLQLLPACSRADISGSVQGQGVQPADSSSRLGAPFGPLGRQQRYGNPAPTAPPQGPAPPPPLGSGYGMPGANLSPHAMPSPSPRGGYANPNAFNSILDGWQGQSRAAPQPQGHFAMQPQAMPAGIGYGGPYTPSALVFLHQLGTFAFAILAEFCGRHSAALVRLLYHVLSFQVMCSKFVQAPMEELRQPCGNVECTFVTLLAKIWKLHWRSGSALNSATCTTYCDTIEDAVIEDAVCYGTVSMHSLFSRCACRQRKAQFTLKTPGTANFCIFLACCCIPYLVFIVAQQGKLHYRGALPRIGMLRLHDRTSIVYV